MITPEQFLQMQIRLGNVQPVPSGDGVAPGREIEELHNPIIKWCREQHPAVPFIYNRPDQASTATEGSPDFVILYQGRKVLVECKTKNGKLSPKQLAFKMLCELQCVEYHVVRSMDEFRELMR